MEAEKMIRRPNLRFIDFWSVTPDDLVTVDSAAGDEALPDVVLPSLWSALPFQAVYAMFKVHYITNSNAGVNAVNGTQYIQVQRVGGAYTNAITIADNYFTVAGSATVGGDILIGATDIKAQVNDWGLTCNFKWTSADVDADSMLFYGVMTGLRIYVL